MASVKFCARCGAEMRPQDAEGFCTRCLLASGLKEPVQETRTVLIVAEDAETASPRHYRDGQWRVLPSQPLAGNHANRFEVIGSNPNKGVVNPSCRLFIRKCKEIHS